MDARSAGERAPVSERLSALDTPLTKFVAPIMIAGVFAAIVVVMLRSPDRVDWFGGSQPWWAPWLVALVGIVASVTFLHFIAPIKRVALEGEELVISNYRRTIRVPLTAIADVRYLKNVEVNDRPVVAVRFLGPSEFGEQITFVAADVDVLDKLERCREIAQRSAAPNRGSRRLV